MSGDTDESEKEYEATQQKLDRAREKGDLVKSAEITVAASYAGVLIASYAFGGETLLKLGSRLMEFLGHVDMLQEQMESGGSTIAGGIIGEVVAPLVLWFIVPMVLVLAALLAQKAIVFAPEKLMPKGSRINPLSNAKQKYGPNGLFEFLKSFVKLVIVAILLGWFIQRHLDRILISQRVGVDLATADLMHIILEFLFLITMLAVIVGAVDYIWQRYEFLKRQKMTRKELMDEMKSAEGDPHMKQQRRQRGIEIAMNQMMAEVPKADVVMVNPTHYAVALKWDRASRRAPICVAKGVDDVALKIREIAAEHNIPIHRDPPSTRALYATLDIGDEIKSEHYKSVAAAIRFADKMRQRARQRRGA
ncbi:flagellar type III secretion system protein FlhB [Thioclava litoralis]|uniref:Flagellar type III secretion system protein FlhB n=1 Tax=Thioclava litoralis TaxID=3076557 RepID=A0ABZ1DUQ6_9RHOB|nr:flagellar type III secretion system protein FlhB [Thioclava sp. FTW29]